MNAPPSPNHVFNFPEEEFEEDPQEEPEEEFEEDPEEEPNEEFEEDPGEELKASTKEDTPPTTTPSVGSPITPSPLSESSSETEGVAPVVASEALKVPPHGSTFDVGGPLSVSPFLMFSAYFA
nr:hypothetical protein [Tanacetum cinerariifolium]